MDRTANTLQNAPFRVKEIVRQVLARCAARGTPFTVEAILSRVRIRALVMARYEIYHRVRNLHPQPSLPQIAGWFNRDHTTVRVGLLRYNGWTHAEAHRSQTRVQLQLPL